MRRLWLVSGVSKSLLCHYSSHTIGFIHIHHEHYSTEIALLNISSCIYLETVQCIINVSFSELILWIYYSHRQKTKKKVNSALFYPTVVTAYRGITVYQLSSCCLHPSAVQSASNLIHMVYIWGSLMVCGPSERLERGGGTVLAPASRRYWMLHKDFCVERLNGGLRRLSLTLKAHFL